MAAAAAAATAAAAAAAAAAAEGAAAAAAAHTELAVDAAGLVGSESLDDARSYFHGGALPFLETQHAQWRDTGGCCHHQKAADAGGDCLPGTELERV